MDVGALHKHINEYKNSMRTQWSCIERLSLSEYMQYVSALTSLCCVVIEICLFVKFYDVFCF